VAAVKLMRSGLGACALGSGFGATTSLSNRFDSQVEPDSFARVASLVLDAGWAWAALAVVAGWLAAAPARGAVAGVVALLAATTVYYGTDSVIGDDPLAWYWPELLRWWLASLVGGSVLGAIGAFGRRPGVLGLLAGLTIPIGATVQMIVSPPGPGGQLATPAENWARLIVLATAAVGAAAVITRFGLGERRRRRDPTAPEPGDALSFAE
jgi:hypothetical protein